MPRPAPIPPSEERRLAALYEYELLDTPSERLFDALTQLAAQLCDAPISLIKLIDRERQWFKSRNGITLQQTPRNEAICAHTILQPNGLLEVADTAADPRFAGYPLVTGEPHVRFYAGVALRSNEGLAVGALCVMDLRPRSLTPEQHGALIAI